MNKNKIVIDSHAHCGIQDHSFDQSFEAYSAAVKHTRIKQVVMFPPVMEIYNRYDFQFKDTIFWQKKRKKANEYLLKIGNRNLFVIPYFFIWNDFLTRQLTTRHKGIKWHRHANEPEYHYDCIECQNAINEIKRRNMPVVLEEELKYTILFIEKLAPGVRVIIPHLGGLNGGYTAIKTAACGRTRMFMRIRHLHRPLKYRITLKHTATGGSFSDQISPLEIRNQNWRKSTA